MKIIETARFRKSLNNLDKLNLQQAKKKFQLFFTNLFHQSLKTEKLKPNHKNIWSFRVNKKIRVIFTFGFDETIILLDIGSHDIYKNL